MKVEELLKTVSEEIAKIVSIKTVIGEQITIEDRTLIPVVKVSFGFGSGGGEGKGNGEGAGSGGGGGACVEPIAFLVVSKEGVQLVNIRGKGIISQLAEVLPEMMEKYRSIREERKKEE